MDVKTVIEMYTENNLSTKAIADNFDTYPNKIRRVLISNGVELRSKSEAQKEALKSGRHSHPTKGKTRTEEVKDKISISLEKTWADLPKKERKRRSALAKEQWEKMSDHEKAELRSKAAKALLLTIKEGSKPEKLLYEKIYSSGREVILHKKDLIEGTKYEMDLFLPELSTIIEVDGPQHFKPVFGEKMLRGYVKHDIIKNGVLVKRGYCVIRVKYLCPTFTRSVGRRLWELVEPVLQQVEKKFPSKNKRLIELEIC